jgi:ATP adenylyltransferase
METLRRMVGVLDEVMHPDGYNIGLNLGRAAGAGLPGHLHWHVVPRWNGDTNFMPVLTDVKVIVQSLDALFDHLTSHMREHPTRNPGP